ncbi:DUF4401 domain-containing protein [Pinisolibacter sp.]|uniref:DUF4401 domain-containing protein n=1 Tax=Pinisolibacter sp. TaxID=2172024 RepID=UPI002FDE0AF0
MTGRPSIDAVTLLASWRRAGLVTAEETPGLASALHAAALDPDPPIYLKILAAVGTALATVFFLGFLFLADLISLKSGTGLVAWGTAFLVSGIAMSMALGKAPPGLGRDFFAQSAFAALAVGKVLVVAGAIQIFGERTPWIPTIALAIVTVATYPVSGSSLDRVLSPYAVAATALMELLGRGNFGAGASVGLAVFHAVATAVAGALLLSHRVPQVLRPIGLAALGAMGTVVCIVASGHSFGFWASRAPLDMRPVEVMLVLSLVGTIAWAAGGFDRLAREPLTMATIGVVALGFAGAPGILFALILLTVGHALHDTPMRVVGILALPAFLVLWYYGKDMTFLVKSATLVGSGALLLAARGFMRLRGWDRENSP